MTDLELFENSYLLGRQELRQGIQELEDRLKAQPQADLPVTELRANGVYSRMLKIPAGTHLTGGIHKDSCINVVLEGEIDVLTEDGAKTVYGGDVFISPPGTKRAGIAIKDTTWITFHGSEDSTDKIKERFIAPDYRSLEE